MPNWSDQKYGMGTNDGASDRPASRLRAAATPASAATCQCSIRISSSPPSWRQSQRATSPAATMPSAAKSGRRTPRRSRASARSRRATRSPGTTPMPTTTASASIASPPASSTTSPLAAPAPSAPVPADALHRDTGAQVHAVRAVQRRAVRAEHRAEHGAQRDVERLEHGDPAPRPAQVEATSAPMKPAPMTTTRAASIAVTAARRASESSRVRSVKRPSRWPSASVPGSRRGEAPVATTTASPCSTVPSSSSTLRPSTSSRTARRPSTSCTRSSLERRLSASTAFSGGHVPASTCLESGGRS